MTLMTPMGLPSLAGYGRTTLQGADKRVETAAGVLDGLLEHEGEDLTSVDALLKMVPPLESALQSYRDRAVAFQKSPEQVVMLETAAHGW